MSSNYEYKRLDLNTNAIRLVRLLKGDADQPIECALFETFLDPDEGTPYEALSYVWGTRESADKIWVNGRLFTVTENLFQALLYLRRPYQDRVLWIDAICIDQTYAAERGHQVRQMSHVYQTAQNVIIWLGTSNDQIDHLFSWMNRLDEEILSILSPHTKLEPEAWAQHWTCLLWRSNKSSPPDEIINAFKEILGREWFSRIWVLQEAALARSATVTCGRNSVSSRTFVVMPILLEIECSENEQSRLEVMPGPLRSDERTWWMGPFSQDLGMLLWRFGKSKSTDPRDIIYALLGLSTDASTSDILRPDYELSLERTIQQTVLYLLQQWSYLQDFQFPEDLPIWDIDQFLFALEDLPQHVFTWAVDHGKDTLTSNFFSSRKDARRLQDMDNFIRGTGVNYGRPPIEIIMKKSSLLDLTLRHRELYLVISDSSGSWPFPITFANQGGTALGLSTSQNNGHGIGLGHWQKDSMILAMHKGGRSTIVDFTLQHADLNRFTLHPDVHASLATAARRGAQVLSAFHSPPYHLLRWREHETWLVPFEKSFSITQNITVNILSDVANALTIHSINGETRSLREYLDARPDVVDMRWRQFRTPLGFAAEANNAATATLLLDRGANIESRDWQKPFATPLWIAASQGHIEIVQILVLWGADMEVLAGGTGNHCTPLWIAASRGFKEVVLFLADMGANINISAWDSDRMRTAVGIAASKLHFAVLGVLAEKGADMGGLSEELRGQLYSATD